jgi:hypothetical protein
LLSFPQGTARVFEVFDAFDDVLWQSKLSVASVVVFMSAKFAQAALRRFPDLFVQVCGVARFEVV